MEWMCGLEMVKCSTETDDERIERYGNDTKVLKTAIEMYERGFSYQA